jgi:lipopolysaccharide/colanic/teichoic acid biosynthesis glycosyltransferase
MSEVAIDVQDYQLTYEQYEQNNAFTIVVQNDNAKHVVDKTTSDYTRDEDSARAEAARVDRVGKYEPKLTEYGIPQDVLEKLLPGDDIIELDEPTIAGSFGYRFVKRAFDIVASAGALIVLAIPMVIIAVKIKAESPGPVFYSQRRVGKDGKIFNVYKFRSMYIDAEARGARWAQGDDPRVTEYGKKLRMKRLDEVPQFWNILRGDMSLIGPRPERPAFCNEFEKRIHGWHYRTCVRPGLSGLAQVKGGYNLLPKEKVQLDLNYIEHRNIAMDLKIIFETLGVVSSGDGAR